MPSWSGHVWSAATPVGCKMCRHGQPAFTTVFGQPIRSVVLYIGLLELTITLVATALNLVKYTQHLDLFGEDCAGKAVCVGPLIKVREVPCQDQETLSVFSLLSTRCLMERLGFSVLSS